LLTTLTAVPACQAAIAPSCGRPMPMWTPAGRRSPRRVVHMN